MAPKQAEGQAGEEEKKTEESLADEEMMFGSKNSEAE